MNDPNEFIEVHNPELPDSTTRVTRQAFEDVWAEKGFIEGTAQVQEGSTGDPDDGSLPDEDN
jgi:hypothetical protein